MGLELQFGVEDSGTEIKAWTSLKFYIWIRVTQILVLDKVYDISGAREILSSKITNATVIQGIENIKKVKAYFIKHSKHHEEKSECIFHKKIQNIMRRISLQEQKQIFPNNNFPGSLIILRKTINK